MIRKRGRVTASELMSELDADPEWVARRAEAERRREAGAVAFSSVAEPVK